jgi:hypothetical protein
VSAEKGNVKTGKLFILLLVVGMIALATWGSFKTVCVPEISPAGLQEDNSHIQIPNYAFSPDVTKDVLKIAV